MLAFLLETHVSLDVLEALKAVRPTCRVEYLAHWRGGVLRTADDETILSAALDAGLVLVTYDLDTIPAILHRWLAQGRPIPGVALIPSGAIPQYDVGGITRALTVLYDEPATLDPAYPVVYLRPA